MNNYAEALTLQLDTFHQHQKPHDAELFIWLHRSYADVLAQKTEIDNNIVYFSPSSANMCPRALYEKALRKKREQEEVRPHQRRWTALGEKVGDLIQEELLLCEKHFERLIGELPRFIIEKRYINEHTAWPAFEEFIFTQKIIEHNGQKFSILGTSDGILYDRVSKKYIGLEVKSKQESPSKTSLKSMQEAAESHIKQCVCYAIMYNLDHYVIAYVNTAKKGWNATEDDLFNTPDIRLFDVDVSNEEKRKVLDFFADLTKRLNEKNPPLPDLTKWRFNPYKKVIAASLTEKEMKELEIEANTRRIDEEYWHKQAKVKALQEIKKLRGESL